MQTAERFAQLDGLRAAAMCGVLYVHLFDHNTTTENLRVSLFFVISGFIITHVLLDAKAKGVALAIHHFFIRRALRLLPALVILVVIASIWDMDGFRASAFWHLGQMSNIYFALHHPDWNWHPWVVGHLWSLNVVEQFYLVAPFIVIFLSRQTLFLVAIGVVITAVFVRVNAAHMGPIYNFIWNVLCYDPIFTGMIARLLLFDDRVVAVARSPVGSGVAAFILAMPLFLWPDYGGSETYRLLMQPALGLIVMQAFIGFSGPLGWVLGSAPARFLAQISYGVFIYHVAVWWGVSQYNPALLEPGWPALLTVGGLSFLLATLSWYLIEGPISRLKRHFPVARSHH